ncbi:MAG: riboflavin synthase [Lachnospiraceae bacterium]|nr:riboflavin synthase [Lachnospiraceae bacterium]
MFTGIIEEMGTISSIAEGSLSAVITVQASKILEGSQVGDSIAVNGVCLTVTSIHGGLFTADVMAETLRRSSLGSLSKGSRVNLERAMHVNGRFGGHIVSGHIDGTGTIVSKAREDNAVWVTINTDKHILKYIVEKGSVAIDGTSLTVAAVSDSDSTFSVSIIPHTGEETIILKKGAGDIVNLENDVIGKYVERLLAFKEEPVNNINKNTPEITMDFLMENGF